MSIKSLSFDLFGNDKFILKLSCELVKNSRYREDVEYHFVLYNYYFFIDQNIYKHELLNKNQI